MFLEQCIDYKILKKELNKTQLSKIDTVIKHFIDYETIYDEGNKDIIEEYTRQYGNAHIIDWYEGLMTTEELLEKAKEDK